MVLLLTPGTIALMIVALLWSQSLHFFENQFDQSFQEEGKLPDARGEFSERPSRFSSHPAGGDSRRKKSEM